MINNKVEHMAEPSECKKKTIILCSKINPNQDVSNMNLRCANLRVCENHAKAMNSVCSMNSPCYLPLTFKQHNEKKKEKSDDMKQ